MARHAISYVDLFGVTCTSWFESYAGALQIASMLADATYVGQLVWPAAQTKAGA